MAEDPVAAEKFRAWSQKKAVRDKALKLISQMESNRVDDESNFKEVTISMCAVDKILKDATSVSGEENKKPGSVKEATMKSVWLKWSIEHKYKFSTVQLTDEEYRGFSGAVKEFMDEETDPASGEKLYSLASLQYDVPAKPKPGEKAKPQTPDQMLKCKIYVKECNKFWKICQQELSNRLNEFLARAATGVGSDTRHRGGGESKEESKGGESKDGDDAVGGFDLDIGSNQLRSESAFLSKIGIGRMKVWLENDQDEALEKERKEKSEAADEARKEHEQWVKKKDSLRIRLPTSDQLSKVIPKPASRMGYGGEMSAVRPAHAGGAKSTIEIMARSGLKYIHATSKGKQGFAGDFEAGQKILEQIKEQETMLQEQEAESKKRSEEAYEQWTLQKDMRDQALKVLPLIELPGVELKTGGPSLSMKTSISISKSMPGASVTGSMTGPNDAAVTQCLEVGKALKKVDRALFQEWSKWCGGVIKFNHAIALWDFFEPKACDVHSATYSQVRDTFQKLLRPGVDYVQAFGSYVEKHVAKQSALADSKSEDAPDVDSNKIQLSKRDMKKFLRSLGFEMKATELRVLIDAFDEDGDGTVSIQEFKKFVGPKREKKGGISAILGQKCCFQSTCKDTGMANAFSISIKPKKNGGICAPIAESKNDDDGNANRLNTQDEKEEDRIITEEGVSKTEKVLPSGEIRIRVELKERLKRVAILRKYGLMSSRSKNGRSAESKDDANDDDYEDDDGYGDDNEFDDAKSEGKNRKDDRCSFIRWSLDDRKDGLRYIMGLTKESRQEQMIKNLLSNGTPPAGPKLWCASPDDPYFRDVESAMTNELLLKWGPDQQADLVSFYSLEFGGASGSNKPQEYREIFRDPENASPESEFELSTLVENLEPGKSYFFRIRGFNGFGPGPFTYKEFCTSPSAPATPRIIKLSSGAVTLRWTFTPSFFKCLEELKRIFNLADADGTGTVERDELSTILKDKAPNSGNISSFLKKVQTSAGISFEYGYDALFDLIESDDDGHLSWDEFEKFFLNVGWSGGTGGGSVAASRASMSGGGGSKANSDGFIYIIEQCSNEFDNKYEEIMKTSAGECTIHRLDPGKSYRFRVFAINSFGIPGAKSEDVVVNTMIETPNAPATMNSTSSIGSKIINLSWKPRNANHSTRDEKVQKKMMGEWSGSGGDNEEGVSVEVAFQQYDKDGNGSIDASELALLLQDLGVEATEERLRNAFDEFDKNGDGVISFDEFSEWWKKEEVEYVLKRSEPVFSIVDDSDAKATSSLVKKTATESSVACPIVSYRGDRCNCNIMGLEPNRLYHFRLRYHGSRSNSQLSPPLVLMTTPLPPPKAPVLIRKSATNVWVKWYSPPGGAYRFVVQLKPEGTSSSASISSTRGGNTDKGGWSNVFNGPETSWKSTTMTPDTSYLLRVCGVNCQGTIGEPSPILRLRTLPRGEGTTLTPKTAQTDFQIECSGDICVGDTILVSERLFEKTVNNTTQFIDTTGVRKSTQGSIVGSGGGNKGTVRLDMSVTSMGSVNGGNAQLGAYLGERTICVHVMKDNYRTLRKEERKGNLSMNDLTVGTSKFSKNRRLMLEVIWQRVSTDACRPYDLKPGVTVERHQAHLEQFEVFRCKWEQEEGRVPLVDDWNSLTDCYVGLNC